MTGLQLSNDILSQVAIVRRVNSGRLRVLLSTGMFPVPHDKTRGRYIYETAIKLSELADVQVVFQQFRYPRLGPIKAKSGLYARIEPDYSVPGLTVRTLEYPAVPGVSRPFNGWTLSRHLRSQIKAIRPDVVLAYWLYPDGYGATLAAKSLRVPVVVGALGSDVLAAGTLNAWFARKVIEKADAVIAVSRDMRDALVAKYGARPSNTYTIVNGINSQNFFPRNRRQSRLDLNVQTGRSIVLYVGRLYRAKGLIELLDAIESVRVERPNAELVIVGDGVMREELEQEIAARNLQTSVHMLGGLEPNEVSIWLGACDVLCLPSWSEGYPNVVVEAVSCGRPVVATDVGGTREIVNERNGILVKPRDVSALAAALDKALATEWNPEDIASSSRRGWGEVASETHDVLRTVVRAAR